MKAPLVLTRWPAIFAAVLAAALVLGAAGAAGALFISSSGNAVVQEELAVAIPETVGVEIDAFGFPRGAEFAIADAELRTRTDPIDELGEPVVTLMSSRIGIIGARQPNPRVQIRLLTRTNAINHIEIQKGANGEGVYVARSSADRLGVKVGDGIALQYGDRSPTARVAGIYRDLALAPLEPYWGRMTFAIISPIENEPPPPPFVIADRDTFFELSEEAFLEAGMTWEYPLAQTDLTLEEARLLESRYRAIEGDLKDPLASLGAAMEGLNIYSAGAGFNTSLFGLLDRVDETISALRSPVDFFSLTGQVLALMIVAAAAVFSMNAREQEIVLFSSQGVHPLFQGVRAALESLVPVVLGAAIGWGLAVLLVRSLGPSEVVSPGVPASAATSSGRLALVAIALAGVVTAFGARRATETRSSKLRQAVARVPWEAILLALALAALYEGAKRRGTVVETEAGTHEADIFLLAFPLLFIAGCAGLIGRGLKRLLPKARSWGKNAGAPAFLAARRLAAASRLVLLLVTAATTALGLLVFAATVAASYAATAEAKSQVAVGSDVAGQLARRDVLVTEDRFPTTRVGFRDAEVDPGEHDVRVMAIDPDTFERAAFWDDSFSDQSLSEIMELLEDPSGERLPVAIAGGDLNPRTLVAAGYAAPIEVVAYADAWPGMDPDVPLLVADFDRLSEAATAAGSSIPEEIALAHYVWVKGETGAALRSLVTSGVDQDRIRTAAAIRAQPNLRSLEWSYGFLQALGVMAGVIAITGLLLYLNARQRSREVSYALARRMGLRRGAHVRAIAGEIAGLLIVSSLLGGALALIAARLVIGLLDPLPDIPAGPLFVTPFGVVAALLPAVVLLVALASWRVQAAADKTNVAEVMRLAG